MKTECEAAATAVSADAALAREAALAHREQTAATK